MKYLRLILIIFFINTANLSYANTQTTTVKPSDYLYVPLVFTNEGQLSANPTVTFEQMFYSALASTLGVKIYNETNCTTINDATCPSINYIYNKAIAQTSVLAGKGSFYPKIILLSDLDYNVTLTSQNQVSWDTVPSNSWSVMPESSSQYEVSFPCGFSSSNYFNISKKTNPNLRIANRAQELSYFCFPIYDNNNDGKPAEIYSENTMQSYINKSYETMSAFTESSPIMRPMFVDANVNTILTPGDSSTSGTYCYTANNYDTTSPKPFWGFPFRGQQCSDTKLENLYFMIIEQVD